MDLLDRAEAIVTRPHLWVQVPLPTEPNGWRAIARACEAGRYVGRSTAARLTWSAGRWTHSMLPEDREYAAPAGWLATECVAPSGKRWLDVYAPVEASGIVEPQEAFTRQIPADLMADGVIAWLAGMLGATVSP